MCIVINHVLNQEPVKCILGQHVYIVSVVGWLCNLILCWMKSFWYRKMEILYLLPKSIPIIKSSHMNLLELEMDTVLDNPTNNVHVFHLPVFIFAFLLYVLKIYLGIYGWYEGDSALSWYMEGLRDALQKHLYNPLREGRRSGEIFDVIFHVNQLYLSKLEEQGIRPSQSYSVPHTTSTLTKSLHFLPKNGTQ